jgi:2-methylaconitate cis-trans-isomerase PrpF
MELDTTKWSGEGGFTQTVIDALGGVPVVAFVRVEDAPATRSEADYNFISNEVFVRFADELRVEAGKRFGFIPVKHSVRRKLMDMAGLESALTAAVGPPDYSDDGMIQYLRTERIVPPYQTRGYKLVELVRIYEIPAT